LSQLISKGPAILMPIIFTFIGGLVGLSLKKSLMSGLKIGVGFLGISIVTTFVSEKIVIFVNDFMQMYSADFSIIDVGWPTAADIAFKSILGLLMIPVCFCLNLLLLKYKLTTTINIDLWNYWHFSFLTVVTSLFSSSCLLGIVVGCTDFVITNYFADLTAKSVSETYDLNGVSFPHSFAIFYLPIVKFLAKILKKFSKKNMKRKLFTIPDPSFVSFFVGILLSISVYYNLPDMFETGVIFSAMALLIPLVSTLLAEGLEPLSTQIRNKVGKRNGINVGITSALVIGDRDVLLLYVVLIPISILVALFLPGNKFFPSASLTGLVYLLPIVVSECERSFSRSLIVSTVVLILSYFFINFSANVITQAAIILEIVDKKSPLISSLDYGNSLLLGLFTLMSFFEISNVQLMIIFLTVMFTSATLNYKLVKAINII